MKAFVTLLMSLAVPLMAQPVEPLRYDFETVKGKVTLETGTDKRPVAQGESAHGGDRVATNWRGRAVVAVAERSSRFEVYASTHVLLASDEPGVLVELERGRLKAWFDALTGNPIERFVKTPGAILAVRGTRYGVEVDARGDTRLTVFEGIVEARPSGPGTPSPLFVRAGESCHFSQGRPPVVSPMHRDESSWDHGGSMGGGGHPGGSDGMMQPGSPGGMMDRPGSGGGMTHPGGSSGHGSGSNSHGGVD